MPEECDTMTPSKAVPYSVYLKRAMLLWRKIKNLLAYTLFDSLTARTYITNMYRSFSRIYFFFPLTPFWRIFPFVFLLTETWQISMELKMILVSLLKKNHLHIATEMKIFQAFNVKYFRLHLKTYAREKIPAKICVREVALIFCLEGLKWLVSRLHR